MTDSVLAGRLSVGFVIAALAALGWTWALSTLADFNPPDWIRIMGILVLSEGSSGVVSRGCRGCGGAERQPAIVGPVIAGLAVVGFVVLLSVAG